MKCKDIHYLSETKKMTKKNQLNSIIISITLNKQMFVLKS